MCTSVPHPRDAPVCLRPSHVRAVGVQEMLEDMEDLDEGALLSVGEFKITVEQHRASLMNLFTLMMDYIELFVQHTRSEVRTHQGVLKEILEAAQTGTTPLLRQACSRRLHSCTLHCSCLSTRHLS